MGSGAVETEQPSLLDPGSVAPAARPAFAAVAQVYVDVPLPHLDHTFDYGIPDAMDNDVHPGVRVKVRFAGTERDGYVVGRTTASTHHGTLAPLRKVVSPVAVLTPEVLELARAVARRYAGTVTDVLRLAVPPRHATAEKAVLAALDEHRDNRVPWHEDGTDGGDTRLPDPHTDATPGEVPPGAVLRWAGYAGGEAFLRRLAGGQSPRAVWSALPWGPRSSVPDGAGSPAQDGTAGVQDRLGGAHWAAAITAAVQAVRAGGRDAVVCVPDQRDVADLSQAMDDAEVEHVVLTADQGASARYRRYLLALTGQAHVVVGTRSAAYAPVRNLGLVVCWDDGDDLHTEQRAPYPHIRDVLAIRAASVGAGALIAGFNRTPHAQALVREGWARSVHAPRAVVRERTPRVVAPGDVDLDREGAAGRARIPGIAVQTVRRGLTEGPVLVQVPRSGYLPVVACQTCRTPAQCDQCHGPLGMSRPDATPTCRWCGRLQTRWQCRVCDGTVMRAVRVGSDRTAEELGRAFPGVPVLVSGGDTGVTDRVDDRPRLVVATPGAEPIADGGYQAGLLLDAAVLTGRPELGASVEALRRWMRAAALVRASGEVMLLGHGAPVPVQALVRWDPVGHAERELGERAELDFPPVVQLAAVTGDPAAIRRFEGMLTLPDGAVTLGPVPVEESGPDGGLLVRLLVRAPRAQADVLGRALGQAAAVRSARKDAGTVRVRVDPDRL
ncbi:primosomal protein N' [Ruania alba]|uniref:Probable replication restart protein PriA n=1 Tax=Ruania alba TaxID=648782 RepID=A0A1H5FVQ3_9MICO|nr:primosomal protein N' [Ruania alba]SEE07244.1 replication restart DNA helicase PriA [Ruania alba]